MLFPTSDGTNTAPAVPDKQTLVQGKFESGAHRFPLRMHYSSIFSPLVPHLFPMCSRHVSHVLPICFRCFPEVLLMFKRYLSEAFVAFPCGFARGFPPFLLTATCQYRPPYATRLTDTLPRPC